MADVEDGLLGRIINWLKDASGRLLMIVGIVISGGNNKDNPDD